MDRYSVSIVVFFKFYSSKTGPEDGGSRRELDKGSQTAAAGHFRRYRIYRRVFVVFFLAIQNGADKIPYMIAVII